MGEASIIIESKRYGLLHAGSSTLQREHRGKGASGSSFMLPARGESLLVEEPLKELLNGDAVMPRDEDMVITQWR